MADIKLQCATKLLPDKLSYQKIRICQILFNILTTRNKCNSKNLRIDKTGWVSIKITGIWLLMPTYRILSAGLYHTASDF